MVEQGNLQALVEAIKEVCENHNRYNSDNCRSRSMIFSVDNYVEYINLFHSLT